MEPLRHASVDRTEPAEKDIPTLGPDSPADLLSAARVRMRLKNDEVEAKHVAMHADLAACHAQIAHLQKQIDGWEARRQTWIGRCLILDERMKAWRQRMQAVRALMRERGFGYLSALTARKLLGRPASSVPAVAPAESQSFDGIDVVICIHNALSDVENCLASVLRYSRTPYRLILVDDGSDPPTRDYLAAFAADQGPELVTLLRNEQAGGYTRAANQGMAKSRGRALVLLNSDTLVTPGWLEKMEGVLNAHPENGIAGPLSNSASWQSVPEIEYQGDWAENPLPEGITPARFSDWLAFRSPRLYPSMSFLNGFCLMIARRVIDAIGYFDEETFARGYGEENDYCLRARHAGFRLRLVDDCYIYHAQSRSYSHEKRLVLAEAAGQALAAKHGQSAIDAGVEQCRFSPVMLGLRATARQLVARQRIVEAGRQRWEGRRVLFVLPIDRAGGGGNVILSEARAMLEMGVDVRILNLSCHRDLFESTHPNVNLPLVYSEGRDENLLLASDYDVVIATVHFTVDWILPLAKFPEAPRLAYYVQDYEPDFYPPGSRLARQAESSYRHGELIRYFTKTEWNRTALAQLGVDAALVGASYECDLFRPRLRQSKTPPEGPVRVCAMVRPSTPRRNPEATMRLLRRLKQEAGAAVEILVFGVEADDPLFIGYPRDFEFTLLGTMNPPQLAALFNEVDIFADFSTFQAMGLTAMEAMSSGVAVIVPQAGGSTAFARDGENALIVDTTDESACFDALNRLTGDHALRRKLAQQAIFDLPVHHPQQAAYRILDTVFSKNPSH